MQLILDMVQQLLPAALGIGLLTLIFVLVQRLSKNNPQLAKQFWLGGGFAAALVVFSVIAFYRKQLTEKKDSKPAIIAVHAQINLPLPTTEEPALPAMRMDLTFIDLSAENPTPYLLLLRKDDRVLLPGRCQLHLGQDPRGNPDQALDIKIMPEKSVFVIEDTSRPDWMFGKAYHIRQETGCGTFWDELGKGWIKSVNCSPTAFLSADVGDDLFSPVLPKELDAIGRDARNTIRADASYHHTGPYSNRHIADQSPYLTDELKGVKGQYTKMIISWSDPSLIDIRRNNAKGLECRMKCEKITLSFPVSLAIGDYLNNLKTNNLSRLARIEGRIEAIDNIFENIVLRDVKLLAYMATTEPANSFGDTDQAGAILTTVPNRSNAQRSSP